MIKIKHKGFSLPEVLITLTIIGALAAVILPGLIKDMNNKANMTLLKGTVANVNSAIQQELQKKHARNIWDTDIYNNSARFLKNNFDYARDKDVFKTYVEKDSNTGKDKYVGISYKSINGTDKGTSNPDGQVILKNGVFIGIRADIDTLVIDLNGPEPPNIIGIDYFGLQIARTSDKNNGIQVGDVGGFQYKSESDATLKSKCKAGDAARCYALVERSGFDPNYLED